MKLLHSIGSELLGLFVDDWVFTLLVIAWVAAFAFLGPRLSHSPVPAAIFFVGIAALTLGFAARKARQVGR